MLSCISEFGRTVHENGNGGTDHGHGNVIWVMGGPVQRRQGLWRMARARRPAQLYQGRDLAVTTDYRAVWRRSSRDTCGSATRRWRKIFPGMPAARGDFADLVAA